MDFKHCRRMRICVSSFLLVNGAASSSPGLAAPCYPSDPTGDNPGNLCPPCPPFGMSIDSNSFVHGSATKRFYGPPVSPIQPGIPVGVQSPKDGYWTKITNQDRTSSMETNKGKTFNMALPDKN